MFFHPAGKKQTTIESSSELRLTKAAKTGVIHVFVGVAAVGSLGHEKQYDTNIHVLSFQNTILQDYNNWQPCTKVAVKNEIMNV